MVGIQARELTSLPATPGSILAHARIHFKRAVPATLSIFNCSSKILVQILRLREILLLILQELASPAEDTAFYTICDATLVAVSKLIMQREKYAHHGPVPCVLRQVEN